LILKRPTRLLAAALLLLLSHPAAWAYKLRPTDGPEVRYVREVWLDPARQRHVNVRIALPPKQALEGKVTSALPVLVFSAPQGFRWGGYADNYEDLSQALLQRGIVTVTLSHYDLDEPMSAGQGFSDVYPGIQTGARNDPAVDRYEDGLFVLSQLAKLNERQANDWPRLDLERLAVGGHSSGTLTALHLAGMPVRDRSGHVVAKNQDQRIKALVLFSYPLEYRGPDRDDLSEVGAVAGLHVAGSRDHPQYRNTSYRYLNSAPQHWLVADGDHNVGATGSEALILELTGRFFDVYLKGETQQRPQLNLEALQPFGPALKQYSSKAAARFKAPDQRDFVAWARDSLPGGRWLHDRAIGHYRNQNRSAEAKSK
jgi:hypothetical protein